jgi:iron(III) transport system substrate-binding protein
MNTQSKTKQHNFKRRALVLGAALGLAFGGALSSGSALAQANSRNVSAAEWNKIVEAAKKEGKVVLYATMAPAVHDRIVAAFNAANPGIKMELVRVVGAAMTTKFEQERLAPNVEGGDAMITADVRWAMNIQKQGLLKTPVGPNAGAWPESYMKNGQIVFLGINPWVLNYNTNLVKTPINSYQDMVRPELAGKIGSTALVAEVVTIWFKWLDDTYPGYLEQMAKLNVKMYPSSVGATAATASGEIHANMFSVIPIDNALHAQKAPLRTVIPNPVYGFSYGGAIVGWAKNPNAALVAMDFLMSVRGQQALVGNQEAASPLPNVPGSLDTTKYKMQLLDWEKATPESLKTFEAKWNKLFGTR